MRSCISAEALDPSFVLTSAWFKSWLASPIVLELSMQLLGMVTVLKEDHCGLLRTVHI